ncbi:E3 ubiquitin-protein ligase Topors-like [Erinaceus europaeus]|uniref:RING-type E3 ubiquitin transferase n=1 Tax=Erinaceus europaeus TaxID=9365 RepID=A0ABM3Y1D5_ERIEU|nr:E3 ubiquitin-protein ligase Topors-like [Erinaceus europaeus]XP_060054886.1 E3 ubiquitin-protein ligase Topors-like [Erinaceus europaeus]
MPLDFSSDCDCPACSEGMQIELGWNSYPKGINNSLYSKSRKKSRSSSGAQYFSSQCCPNRPEKNKDGYGFPPSEEESEVETSQNNHLYLNPEGIPEKLRPLKELTLQELLMEFGDSWTVNPNDISVGHFRDQVVMKFRRALYYSGIWVAHVQGYRPEKHFSANYFKKNPGSLQRLVPWLKRELTAVYGDYGYTVKNILTTILHHMVEHDLDSECFIHLLNPYLQQYTHQFLHELISFVHSPYNMETYDQKAIYQCPSPSLWIKRKPTASVPISPLLKCQDACASQHDTSQSEHTQDQKTDEMRPLLGLKLFPNNNLFLRKSEIPEIYYKTASNSHNWLKQKPESGDYKDTICNNNPLLNCTVTRERDPGLPNPKKHAQGRKTEGVKLLPGHNEDLRKRSTTASTFNIPTTFNQGQPWRSSLSQTTDMSLDQQNNCPKNKIEKDYQGSSPKIFEISPRGRSLVRCKPRGRDPSWSGISEVALYQKSDGKKLTSFKKKRMKWMQSSHSEDIGSHLSRRIQKQTRSRTQRSKSWCCGFTKRSISRDSSHLSLRGSNRSEFSTQNICCAHLQEQNVKGYQSAYLKASSATTQHRKLSSTAGRRSKCPKNEYTSQAGNQCNGPAYPYVEKHGSPRKPKAKQKLIFPNFSKTSPVSQRKNKGLCADSQNTEAVGDEMVELNELKKTGNLSECVSSYGRRVPKKKNVRLQKQ